MMWFDIWYFHRLMPKRRFLLPNGPWMLNFCTRYKWSLTGCKKSKCADKPEPLSAAISWSGIVQNSTKMPTNNVGRPDSLSLVLLLDFGTGSRIRKTEVLLKLRKIPSVNNVYINITRNVMHWVAVNTTNQILLNFSWKKPTVSNCFKLR